jgi:hypothetical protein
MQGFTANAYTTSDLTSAGWTQVTSLSDVNNYYYVFVDAGQQTTAMFRNNNSDARPFYNTLANPMENLEEVWVIAQNGVNFNIKGNSESFFFNSGNAGWNDYVGHNNDNGDFIFTLNEGKYDIKSVTVNSYVGPWNNDGAVSATLPENVACNKEASQAPGFILYSILKTTFDGQLAEARATAAADASKSNPADVTSYIVNADFTSKNAQGWTRTGTYGNQQWGQSTMESWKATNVVVKQEIRGVPNGSYRLTADVISGTGATKAAFIYGIGSSKVSSDVVSAEASAGNYNTMSSEVAGKTLTADNIVVTNNTITIGLDQSTGWIVADNFKLYYLGVDLSAFIDAYNAALSTAQGYEGNLFDEDWATLSAVITANTLNTASATQNELTTATANLSAAIDVAAVAAAKYTIYTNANTLINGGENVDLTSLIVNPSFENNFTGWTNIGSMAIQGNTSFKAKDGSYYCEYWQPNGTKGVSQTIAVLPAGLYSITVRVKARGVTSAKIFAAGIDQAVTIEDAENEYTVNFALDDKGSALIGFEGVGTGAGNSWLALDNFRLNYVGALPASLTAVTGKMNATVSATQTNAVNAYNANHTVANYNAAQAAITAAEASIAAYSAAATAVADANAVKDNHNFASAEAITTFAEAIAAISDKYDAGTLTQEEAANAGTTLGTVVSGWHGNNNSAAAVYMRNGFALGDFLNDPSLQVNTWSTEGDDDGSGFSVPFYQVWNADANSLPESTYSGTITGLSNGQYKISAIVRVRAKNETAATDATGITIDVNGGDAVDVTEGSQIGEGQFQIATYEAIGLVKQGTLTLNFNVASDANISWLCFKNVKYTKVRDLNPEEAAVVPTAIALKNGEDVVTEVTLTAAANTVTLTPAYTPNDASEGYIEWTTSDANVATVADGVVTGVLPGTATITATSTLDNNVSANVTVTVSYPETVTASEDEVVSGSAISTVTYGENLIKNGTFEYPNSFQGWKSGANGNCDANNYNIVTDGDNKYIQAKESKGAGDSHSISTGWPIEAGKTYVFGYKVKADAAGNSQYHVVSMTNTIGTETAKVSVDATPVTTSWTDVKYKFTNPTENGYAYIQFRARWLANNTSFDDFYLVEVTSETTVGNVAYATAAIPTANIGEGAFQYSQSAIDAANALVQGEATVEDVEAAYTALTTVNEPADGQLFNVILTYGGWTYDQKAMTYIANGRTDGGLYNIQYKEAANQNLAQAFTFTKVRGNNYKMSQIDADGDVRYISTGVPYGGSTTQIRTTTNVNDALVVTVIPTASEGKWNLRNTEANEYIGSQDAGVFTKNSHIDFNIVETTKPSITINTTDAGWGTVMLPFAVASLPEGVKAYSCAEIGGKHNSTLTLVEVKNALEANKPYIIEGDWNETLTGAAQGTELTYTEGLLTGTYSKIPAPNGSYILQNKEKVGFYKVNTEVAQPNVPANHAYLTYTAGGGSRAAFFFTEDETTGIAALKALTEGDAQIFDASGRAQQRLVKGLNIVVLKNGQTQKIVVK